MAKRCIYEDDQGKCRRIGKGNPPLCDEHNDVEFEYEEFIDTALEHPKIANIVDKINDVVGLGKKFLENLAQGENPLGKIPNIPKQKKQVVKISAREILHFGPSEILTKEKIKERKNALAHMAHPDKGGSNEAMARILNAAKELENEVK